MQKRNKGRGNRNKHFRRDRAKVRSRVNLIHFDERFQGMLPLEAFPLPVPAPASFEPVPLWFTPFARAVRRAHRTKTRLAARWTTQAPRNPFVDTVYAAALCAYTSRGAERALSLLECGDAEMLAVEEYAEAWSMLFDVCVQASEESGDAPQGQYSEASVLAAMPAAEAHDHFAGLVSYRHLRDVLLVCAKPLDTVGSAGYAHL